MRPAATLLLIGFLGCTKAGTSSDPVAVEPGARPVTQPAQPQLTVAITSVTLADDCGGGPSAPAEESKSERKRAPGTEAESDRREAQARCEQTSMQLSVIGAPSGTATQLRVKKVELLDDKGNLVGELTPRSPTIWSQDGTYRPWDQMVPATNQLSVSYALSAPRWGGILDRWNKTYVLRAVLTVGATDRTVQRDVHLTAPAMLDPMVET